MAYSDRGSLVTEFLNASLDIVLMILPLMRRVIGYSEASMCGACLVIRLSEGTSSNSDIFDGYLHSNGFKPC
ncbi:MAG: hypothetical protein FRX49_06642 [Trebouxia sp. A1-2]|nr:MAG: hypothetical protein FRX49_06642 [Trebouxia sp. A1-2]